MEASLLSRALAGPSRTLVRWWSASLGFFPRTSVKIHGKFLARSRLSPGMRFVSCACAALTVLLTTACGEGGSSDAGWTLTFADEFDGAPGPIDPTRWTIEVNDKGGGNRELQYYTDRLDNLRVDGAGHLVVTARKEDYLTRSYTSARLNTKGKFEQAYGRFEAKMRLPRGKGLWPAFWLLGHDIDATGWPKCGEIDVMENRGAIPTMVSSALHGPQYFGGSAITRAFRKTDGVTFTDEPHVFAVEWEPGEIRFYVDGSMYHQVFANRLPNGHTWVFDRPFFLIVNLAVGGTFGGDPDDTTPFPSTLEVDYVRAYARK